MGFEYCKVPCTLLGHHHITQYSQNDSFLRPPWLTPSCLQSYYRQCNSGSISYTAHSETLPTNENYVAMANIYGYMEYNIWSFLLILLEFCIAHVSVMLMEFHKNCGGEDSRPVSITFFPPPCRWHLRNGTCVTAGIEGRKSESF